MTPRSLHIEMPSGVAGDMLNAALLSLFPDLDEVKAWLLAELSHLLSEENITLQVETVKPGGIQSRRIRFHTPEDDWYNPTLKDGHSHKHGHRENIPHRNYDKIETLLQQSPFSDQVKSHSLKSFEVLAKVEGSVHGIDYRQVHFHEVGSLDAILEVCGFFLLLERLGITEITATPLVIGSGTVKCAHGLMPVPVPAVLNMISEYSIPHKKIPWDTGELTTPTGLAILLGSSCQFTSSSEKAIKPPSTIGYGAGHKEIPGLVNILRMTLIELGEKPTTPHLSETVYEIKVNLDDMSGEEIAALVKEIFAVGALDVCQYPVYMKKNRPGIVLEILCHEKDRPAIGTLLLEHSSSPGYRYRTWIRETLPRKQITLHHRGHDFSAKEITLPRGSKRIKVEDDSLQAGMEEIPISRQKLLQELTSLYHREYQGKSRKE